MYGGLRMWLYESVRPVGGPGWFRKRGFCCIFAMFFASSLYAECGSDRPKRGRGGARGWVVHTRMLGQQKEEKIVTSRLSYRMAHTHSHEIETEGEGTRERERTISKNLKIMRQTKFKNLKSAF